MIAYIDNRSKRQDDLFSLLFVLTMTGPEASLLWEKASRV